MKKFREFVAEAKSDPGKTAYKDMVHHRDKIVSDLRKAGHKIENRHVEDLEKPSVFRHVRGQPEYERTAAIKAHPSYKPFKAANKKMLKHPVLKEETLAEAIPYALSSANYNAEKKRQAEMDVAGEKAHEVVHGHLDTLEHHIKKGDKKSAEAQYKVAKASRERHAHLLHPHTDKTGHGNAYSRLSDLHDRMQKMKG